MGKNIKGVIENAEELDIHVEFEGKIDGKELDANKQKKVKDKLSFGQQNEDEREKKIKENGEDCQKR